MSCILQVYIYARPQLVDKLQFAAHFAPRVQAWFEQETGIPYELPKIGECWWDSRWAIWTAMIAILK